MKRIGKGLALSVLAAALSGGFAFGEDHNDHPYVHHDEWKKGYHMQHEDWDRGEKIDYRITIFAALRRAMNGARWMATMCWRQ